ncbi:MAG: hypothetical protein M3081_19165 [Gemmatimonadota bacterium]|nr:hypothetical protein [Gemmatimonadota bacterium]
MVTVPHPARRARRGATRFGCLLQLLVLAVLLYFGVTLGEVYLRFYRFQDAMKQQARFADNTPDAQIVAHLRAVADSLHLPDDAQGVTVQRTAKELYISAEYSDTINLSVTKRVVRMHPNVLRTF